MKAGDKFRLREGGPVHTVHASPGVVVGDRVPFLSSRASSFINVVDPEDCIPEVTIEPGDLLTYKLGPRYAFHEEAIVVAVVVGRIYVKNPLWNAEGNDLPVSQLMEVEHPVSYRKPEGYGEPIVVNKNA